MSPFRMYGGWGDGRWGSAFDDSGGGSRGGNPGGVQVLFVSIGDGLAIGSECSADQAAGAALSGVGRFGLVSGHRSHRPNNAIVGLVDFHRTAEVVIVVITAPGFPYPVQHMPRVFLSDAEVTVEPHAGD